jgi:hypothetical protein
MDVGALHGYVIGSAVIGSWVVVGFWALALRFTRYDETPTFWRAVSVAQILLAVQLLVGLGLLLFGRRPADGGLGTLAFHVSYGLLSPLVVLFVSHRWARDGRYNPYTVFAVAGLVIVGLAFRAYQVGRFGA